jgi:hypothetical protein
LTKECKFNKLKYNSGSNPGNADSVPTEPPLFSVHKLVVGFGSNENYEGWIELKGGGYSHERWFQVNSSDLNAAGAATRVTSGDIDGDGKDEIIIGLGPVASEPSLPGGVFEILDDDFTHLAWGEIGWSDYNEANGESWPSTGDIDGDGKDEIIIGLGPGGEGKFETLRLSSADLVHMDWGEINWQDYKDLYGEIHPSSADIDFDGKDEIVVGLGKGGDGWIDILDDASKGYSLLTSIQTELVEYGEVSGETWPSIRFSRTLSDNDSDKDGLTDEEEARPGLLANSEDTDGDGHNDFNEILAGTDPLNASSVPRIDGGNTSRAASANSGAATVTLAWDSNTDADLAGYRVSYGLESGNYSSHVDVGNKTSHTLTGLTTGRTYYFATKAYNTANQESAYSEEISYMLSTSGKIATIAPSGSITNNIPTFTWYAFAGSTLYYLGAKDTGGLKVLKVYTAEESGCASGGGICSITPQMAFLNGPAKWAVQPRESSDEHGAWSDIVSFSLN